jgi:endonuclease/exonuclease/phosphatase family metal-dependent hydrolase
VANQRVRRAVLFVLAVGLWAGALVAASAEPVRVMTFNVRYGTADDGPNHWERRREHLLDVIRGFDPDVLGVQEALRAQVDAIAEALPGHSAIGVGREADGGGEYSTVFYRRSRFDVEAAETRWLSDHPNEPGSHTWGNDLPRICTEVRLVERAGGRRFMVLNTHWDHISQPARVRSGAMMAERIAETCEAGTPVLVTGDFNAGEDNPAIAALTRSGRLIRDTFRALHVDERSAGTFHGFSGKAGSRKIDAVFATPDWRVKEAAIVRDSREGRYPSDHFPVTAVVDWPAGGAGESQQRQLGLESP